MIGNGLVFSEGHEHKLQRKLLSPAFAYVHVKRFVPVFMAKTVEVMSLFDEIVKDGPAVFPIFSYFSRLTLDAIGEASFGVNFNAIGDEHNELVKAYETVSSAGRDVVLFNLFAMVPGWKYVPIEYNRSIRHSRKILSSATAKVLTERKAELAKSRAQQKISNLGDGEFKENKNRDILSIMLESDENVWTGHNVENQIMTCKFFLDSYDVHANTLFSSFCGSRNHRRCFIVGFTHSRKIP